jgi:predicted ester cyclase
VEEAPVSTQEEQNKALVRRFYEEQAKGNLDVIDEVLTSDFVDHDRLPGQEPDRQGYKRAIAEYHAAFSDVRLAIDDQVAAGDKVVTRFAISGIHDRGVYEGVAPIGREVTYKAIAIHRVSGGKIVEEWAGGSNVSDLMEQRVEQELRVARRIQQASLPKEVPELEGWQISPYYRPAREVGGDFYDFLELKHGQLGFFVGDATGKGVPAALVMAAARSTLRAFAQGSDSPGDVLRRTNDPLVNDIPANMFVTCFYAILDPERGNLTYANAGHDLAYVRRSGGGCEELRARGMPLGLMPGMAYEENEIVLEPRDNALLYSDGLVEAHDPNGEMFGFPRLRTLVAEYGEEGSLEEALLEELYSFVGKGWEQEDDITLLTLRRSGT